MSVTKQDPDNYLFAFLGAGGLSMKIRKPEIANELCRDLLYME